MEDVWLPAAVVAKTDLRAYEKCSLRKVSEIPEQECNKDTSKGVDQTVVGRKTAGMF